MRDYKNMSCAACDVVFDDNSDIVVCPICGAPHHRDCWNEVGHCACEGSHSNDFSWQPPVNKAYSSDSSDNADVNDENNMLTCPICGCKTSSSEDYCEKCGYYLAHNREGAYGDFNTDINADSLFDIKDGEIIQGVPAGDLKKYIGNMWIYYLPRFNMLNKKLKMFTFNFTAAIAHGIWFISRKMYGIGAFILALMTGIAVYQVYFYERFNNLFGGVAGDSEAYSALMQKHPEMVLGMLLYYFAIFMQYGVMLFCGLFGNRIYMKHSAKSVKKINAKATVKKSTPEQFNIALAQLGGISWLPMISAGFCYLLFLYVLNSGLLF